MLTVTIPMQLLNFILRGATNSIKHRDSVHILSELISQCPGTVNGLRACTHQQSYNS